MNVRTISDAMNRTVGAKTLCMEIHRFLELFLTVPVITSASEKTPYVE